MSTSLTVDLVTQKPDGTFVLVLVEQGPWNIANLQRELRRLQDRLYDCVDAAIDGKIATKFPNSSGKPIIIRVNGFDLPKREVADFLERFIEHVGRSPEIQHDLQSSGYVASIGFEYNLREFESDSPD